MSSQLKAVCVWERAIFRQSTQDMLDERSYERTGAIMSMIISCHIGQGYVYI